MPLLEQRHEFSLVYSLSLCVYYRGQLPFYSLFVSLLLPPPPNSASNKVLGKGFGNCAVQLENKCYVKHYVGTVVMTHEYKGTLSQQRSNLHNGSQNHPRNVKSMTEQI
jgi:hypothetical protein